MVVSSRIAARVESEFPAEARPLVCSLLDEYSGPESERVNLDVLQLAAGEVGAVRRYVAAARLDYRDVLYWAEYSQRDPLLQGRDPQQLMRELLDAYADGQ